MSSTIIYERRGSAAWLTINRPEVHNALNTEVHLKLREALKQAEVEDGVKVVVITGAGEKAFCVGADVKEFLNVTPLEVKAHTENSRKTIEAIVKLGKPVIAAINGLALGTGCEIVLACDLAVASTNAKLGQPEVRLNLIPGMGATQRLPLIAGIKKAKEMLMTGRLLNAEEAERMGLINKVVAPEKLKEAVEELVKTLSLFDPGALRLIKEAVNRPLEALLDFGMSLELKLFALNFTTEAPYKGIKTFLKL